jgi:D-lactate dehydrogenase
MAAIESQNDTGNGAAQKVQLKIAVFSAQHYVKDYLAAPLGSVFADVRFFEPRLDVDTAALAHGFDAVCLFVNDDGDEATLKCLADAGVKFIAMRCAGYDRLDLEAAKRLGMRCMRVPTYSPRSVAEMALTMVRVICFR